MKNSIFITIIIFTILVGRGFQRTFYPKDGLASSVVTTLIVCVAVVLGNVSRKNTSTK